MNKREKDKIINLSKILFRTRSVENLNAKSQILKTNVFINFENEKDQEKKKYQKGNIKQKGFVIFGSRNFKLHNACSNSEKSDQEINGKNKENQLKPRKS